ncbi:hypothetical protein [Trujillonella humicola]|uniref:hypothetical protein n=1 Tax=Trujillonella humicola TaxID=3383699 RepID=UPI003905BB86
MTAVWVAALVVSAALMGWGTATELRMAKPAERIPLSTWRPQGRPTGIRWLAALGSGGIVIASLMVASEDWAVAFALVTGGVLLALIVQTVLLRRHNQQIAHRP